MVKALLAVLGVLRSAWLFELVGASLVVAALHEGYGVPAALGGAGAGLLLKAYEIEGRSG